LAKGFFTFAQNSIAYFDEKIYVDYVKHAYALAMSIQLTQKVKDITIAITPGYKVPDKYKQVFDQIIEIPWGDMASNYDNKFHNEWKAGHITPYDETIKIEADMILTAPIDDWWEYMSLYDVLFTNKVHNYRNEEITSRFCRKVFDTNNLPNVYNGFMYFKKDNSNSKDFFKMAEMITKDYEKFSNDFLDHTRPKLLDTDTIYGLAVKLLDKEAEFVRHDIDVPTFIHMKKELMNWEMHYDSYAWTRCLKYYFDDKMNLYVSNYKQSLPFHYHEKNFLTEDTIKMYEKALGI